MTEVLKYDLVIIGSGLAGLRAAFEAARVSQAKSGLLFYQRFTQ